VRGVAGNAALMLHADARRATMSWPTWSSASSRPSRRQAPGSSPIRCGGPTSSSTSRASDSSGGGSSWCPRPSSRPASGASWPSSCLRRQSSRRSGPQPLRCPAPDAATLDLPAIELRRPPRPRDRAPGDRTAAPGWGGQPEVARSSSTRSSPSPSQSAKAGTP
jgi:hypothetical protein